MSYIFLSVIFLRFTQWLHASVFLNLVSIKIRLELMMHNYKTRLKANMNSDIPL